jgi:hypothetical protein
MGRRATHGGHDGQALVREEEKNARTKEKENGNRRGERRVPKLIGKHHLQRLLICKRSFNIMLRRDAGYDEASQIE